MPATCRPTSEGSCAVTLASWCGVGAGGEGVWVSEVFDSDFRRLLAEILRRAPRLRGGRQGEFRSRRQRRSDSGTFSGHRGYSAGEDLRLLPCLNSDQGWVDGVAQLIGPA